jgi:hypothetical protein
MFGTMRASLTALRTHAVVMGLPVDAGVSLLTWMLLSPLSLGMKRWLICSAPLSLDARKVAPSVHEPSVSSIEGLGVCFLKFLSIDGWLTNLHVGGQRVTDTVLLCQSTFGLWSRSQGVPRIISWGPVSVMYKEMRSSWYASPSDGSRRVNWVYAVRGPCRLGVESTLVTGTGLSRGIEGSRRRWTVFQWMRLASAPLS